MMQHIQNENFIAIEVRSLWIVLSLYVLLHESIDRVVIRCFIQSYRNIYYSQSLWRIDFCSTFSFWFKSYESIFVIFVTVAISISELYIKSYKKLEVPHNVISLLLSFISTSLVRIVKVIPNLRAISLDFPMKMSWKMSSTHTVLYFAVKSEENAF